MESSYKPLGPRALSELGTWLWIAVIASTFGLVTMLLLSSLVVVAALPSCMGWGPPGSTVFTAAQGFPTAAFTSYYILPASATKEPQPIISDSVLSTVYPLNLTDPDNIPIYNAADPLFYPTTTTSIPSSAQATHISSIVAKVSSIIQGNSTSNCTKCIAALQAAQSAAWAVPSLVPNAMISICQQFKYQSSANCVQNFNASTFGAPWTQILAYSNVSGSDGQYICNYLGYCSKPALLPLNLIGWWSPKPANASARIPKPSRNRVKVVHLSDFHLDARYSVGSEANCTSNLCCRSNNNNTSAAPGKVLQPASYYGAFDCDSPYGLGLSALSSVGPLTGTNSSAPLGFSIFTGDLESHDPQSELSRALSTYTETTVYGLFKKYLGGPVYAALGNHDTSPESLEIAAPYASQQQGWHYDHIAGLWEEEGWIAQSSLTDIRTHYGGYSTKNSLGLRVIAINTDFWYKSNFYNFINSSNPDNSGMLRWLTSELQSAENAGERVWIIGHVLSGWDGSNPLTGQTNLFYQIVERYSPHVIANIFFGHTHEDQFTIFYANNGTVQNASTALSTAWIGPSITPLTNLNSGYRMYYVDTGDWNIYDAYTFNANVTSFPSLSSSGPVWSLEYSTRDTYGAAAGWPSDAPLNATFWHRLTEAMETNTSLVTLHNKYQGKLSTMSPNCTNSACVKAKICYMRSGSVALGSQCPQGYGSVQSPFTPTSS